MEKGERRVRERSRRKGMWEEEGGERTVSGRRVGERRREKGG